MRINAEVWAALVWIAASAFITSAGWSLGLGALREPGSGFALFWCGLLMLSLSAFVGIGALVGGGPGLASLWDGVRWHKVALVVALLLAYGFGFERIGFIVGTLILLLVLMTLVDPVDWRVAVPVSVVATLGVWAALTKWLLIQLPAGVLEPWIG